MKSLKLKFMSCLLARACDAKTPGGCGAAARKHFWFGAIAVTICGLISGCATSEAPCPQVIAFPVIDLRANKTTAMEEFFSPNAQTMIERKLKVNFHIADRELAQPQYSTTRFAEEDAEQWRTLRAHHDSVAFRVRRGWFYFFPRYVSVPDKALRWPGDLARSSKGRLLGRNCWRAS